VATIKVLAHGDNNGLSETVRSTRETRLSVKFCASMKARFNLFAVFLCPVFLGSFSSLLPSSFFALLFFIFVSESFYFFAAAKLLGESF
jgi:hypothetical protein